MKAIMIDLDEQYTIFVSACKPCNQRPIFLHTTKDIKHRNGNEQWCVSANPTIQLLLRIKRWPVIAQQNACCIGCVLQVQIFGLKAAFLRRTPQSLVWVLHAIRVGYGGAIFAENKPNIISCDFVSNNATRYGGAMCNFNGIEVGDTASIGGAFACVF
eukprot:353513_1